jgi:hypothetical protein
MEFSRNSSDRPPLEYIIGKPLWQTTSLKAMVGMCHLCTVSTGTNLPVNDPATAVNSCSHNETKSEEDYFFAPTGKGSIVTTISCAECGLKLSSSSEYFD